MKTEVDTPVGLAVNGSKLSFPNTTNEQVASKPIPRISLVSTFVVTS